MYYFSLIQDLINSISPPFPLFLPFISMEHFCLSFFFSFCDFILIPCQFMVKHQCASYCVQCDHCNRQNQELFVAALSNILEKGAEAHYCTKFLFWLLLTYILQGKPYAQFLPGLIPHKSSPSIFHVYETVVNEKDGVEF